MLFHRCLLFVMMQGAGCFIMYIVLCSLLVLDKKIGISKLSYFQYSMINIVAFTKNALNSHTPNYSCCVPPPFPSQCAPILYFMRSI